MKRILIDTDVVLDFLFDRKPFSDNAANVIRFCEDGKVQGFVTPVIISNVYYILRRNSTHQQVIYSLKLLLQIIDVLYMDRKVIDDALNSRFKDFEDALQYFSATNSGSIEFIITRNTKDFRHSRLKVMKPEEFLKDH